MSLILDQYAERLRRKRRSVYSQRNFDVVSRRFERWLSAQGLSAEGATYELIEDYIDGLDLAPSSRGQHLRWIQAAYNYAIKRGTIRHNPTLDIDVEQEPDAEPRIIAPAELREIKERAWRDKDWVFFHLLAYTGMRRSEIRGLTWDKVSLEDETIRVLGKGQKLRLVPIHPALGEVLQSSSKVTQFVVTSSGQHGIALDTIQEMSRRLHPTFTPHDYRRTVATSLRRNGVDTGVIDRIMGWAPRSVFRRYYDNVADIELKRGILRLYADDPV
jgi:integrase